jgi:hypothetical protein
MVLFVGWTALRVIWLTDDTALAQSLSIAGPNRTGSFGGSTTRKRGCSYGNRQVAHLAGNGFRALSLSRGDSGDYPPGSRTAERRSPKSCTGEQVANDPGWGTASACEAAISQARLTPPVSSSGTCEPKT